MGERKKMTVPQLARIWGVSPNKILRFIRAGELRATNFATSPGGRPRYFIDLADVQAFELSRTVIPTASVPPMPRRGQTAPGSVRKFF